MSKNYTNKDGLKYRWRPMYWATSGVTTDEFLGYANELDVWLDMVDNQGKGIAIIGPDSKLLKGEGACNFDVFTISGDTLIPYSQPRDVHIDPHDMCLIYALCVEHGVFNQNNKENDRDQT